MLEAKIRKSELDKVFKNALGNLREPKQLVYECELCKDDRVIVDMEKRTARPCKCALVPSDNDRSRELERFNSIVPAKIIRNLSVKDIRADQVQAYKVLKTKSGVWLWGDSGTGKTHRIASALSELINHSNYYFKWEWLSAKQLFDLFLDQYTDDRRDAKSRIHKILDCDLLILDDFDKIGNFTPARSTEFFDLIRIVESKEIRVLASSQLNINEYCKKITDLSISLPVKRRMNEIFKHQVYMGKPKQVEI